MMVVTATAVEWILAVILMIASVMILFVRKPVYAGLSFLVALLVLSAIYLQLSTEFIGVMQILVYAGAILVIFMFVIILFQDAYQQIEQVPARSKAILLCAAGGLLLTGLVLVGFKIRAAHEVSQDIAQDFGTVEALGKALYIDAFFPFEIVILLFLVALVGSLYIAKAHVPTIASEIGKEKE
jgi:NADH-quinone oxidoreductase subunit J